MNSLFRRAAVSSASLRSRSARSTRAVSLTSRQVNSTLPSGSGIVASCSVEPSERSVEPLQAASAVMRAIIRVAHRRPVSGVVVEVADLLDDVADMRLAVEIRFGEAPDPAIGRIVQFEPSVAAEHGDRLEQIVERLALHLDQRVVRPFEREPVGHVLIDKNQAAQRMRRDRHAEGPPVRQMQQLAFRLDQRGEQLRSAAA